MAGFSGNAGLAGPDALQVREVETRNRELEQELKETRRANEILRRSRRTRPDRRPRPQRDDPYRRRLLHRHLVFFRPQWQLRQPGRYRHRLNRGRGTPAGRKLRIPLMPYTESLSESAP